MPRSVTTLFLLLAAACFVFACGEETPAPLRIAEPVSDRAIDLNSASVEELTQLPGIGTGTARKIVEFRRAYGPFRRTERLLLVDGISEKKYRELRPFVMISAPGN